MAVTRPLVWILGVLGAATLTTAWIASGPAEAKSEQSDRKLFEVSRGELRVTLTEHGTLVAKESKRVKPQIKGEGKITWLIEEGTSVEEGAELCKLDTKEVEQEIEQLELDLVQAETALDSARTDLEIQKADNLTATEKAEMDLNKAETDLERYRDGDAKQERRKLEIAIKDAETTLSRKRKIYEDSQTLVEQKFIRRTELEDHELEFDKARVQMEGAQLDLELFEKYTYPMTLADKEAAVRKARREREATEKRNGSALRGKEVQVTQAEKKLKKLKQRLEDKRKDLGNMVLTAPVPGIVIYGDPSEPWMRREIRVGRSVWRGYTIMTIPDLRVMQVNLKIHEADIAKLKAGLPAKVTMDTYPGVVLDAEVTKIAQIAGTRDPWGENTEVKLFDIELTIKSKPEQPLKPGISATAEIFIDAIEDTLSVPLQSVVLDAGKHYCFVMANGAPERRELEVGLSNQSFIEVTGGLVAGEKVLLYNPTLGGPGSGVPREAPSPAAPAGEPETADKTAGEDG